MAGPWWVTTGSRLHFGLLSLAEAGEFWPDADGQPSVPSRRFGGAGLMMASPGLRLRLEEASEWAAEGPMAERVLAFARACARVQMGPPRRLVLEEALSEHVGLGSGTQLGLAVAAGLARSWDLERPNVELAAWVGRGQRSALGVYGFEKGGFLLEAGQGASATLAPLVARLEFPSGWKVLLVRAGSLPGRSGDAERQALGTLRGRHQQTDALCRLALLGLVPALVARDYPAFGAALTDFNRRSGELFSPVQGGPYSSPRIAATIAWLQAQGVGGVGQSSWGPTVFAILPDADKADFLASKATEQFADNALVTSARNAGAEIRPPGFDSE
jgi:beta-ribofuranosylaminobenzene 5'-phosphate synthase